MGVHLKFLFIFTGLTGIHSITTVRDVSVKAGDSITIPCLYNAKYKNHVKYLCKGKTWQWCSYEVKTNQPDRSGKFLISDNKNQTIFTVTIKDLTHEDAHYWCIVEIVGGTDVGDYFHLSVTEDMRSLYVDNQEITGYNGDKITINCYYKNSGERKWCGLGKKCVTGSSGSIDGTKVSINSGSPNVFTVTMTELTTKSSGWYWCVNGNLQMPVHVIVTEKTTTRCPTTLSTILHGHTPVTPSHSATGKLEILIILLSLLIFIAIVTLFIWFMLKKHKQSNTISPTMSSHEECDLDITYSSVVAMTTRKPTKDDAEDNVTYCTLAQVYQKT